MATNYNNDGIELSRVPRSSSSTKESKKGNTKKIILIIGAILLLIAVVIVCIYFYQKFKMRAAEIAMKEEEVKVYQETGALNAGGVIATVEYDDPKFWSNPTAVATYIAEACAKGKNYQSTSRGCIIVHEGMSNLISQETWKTMCAEEAKKWRLANGTKIQAGIDKAVDNFCNKNKNQAWFADGNDNSSRRTTTKQRLGDILAKAYSYNEVMNLINGWTFTDYYRKDCSTQATAPNGSPTGFDYAVWYWQGYTCQVGKLKGNKATTYTKKVISEMKNELVAALPLSIWEEDYTASHSPDSMGYVILEPLTDECAKIKREEKDYCVNCIEKLVADGSVTTLAQINSEVLNTSSQTTTTSINA